MSGVQLVEHFKGFQFGARLSGEAGEATLSVLLVTSENWVNKTAPKCLGWFAQA